MLTLLLIEPHAVLRQSLRQWLAAELFPCAVIEAADVAQAIALVAVEPPCLILVDLDSITLLELNIVQRLPQFCACRVVGLGLDDTPAHRLRAQREGVSEFVAKDQLQTDLIPLIRRLLD